MMKPETRHNLIHGITLALLFFAIALALRNGTQAARLHNQLDELQQTHAATVQAATACYRKVADIRSQLDAARNMLGAAEPEGYADASQPAPPVLTQDQASKILAVLIRLALG